MSDIGISSISNCDFFKGNTIEIDSIYKNDPIEKCFLVRDLSRRKNFKVRIPVLEHPTNADSEYEVLKYLHQKNISWCPIIYEAPIFQGKRILICEFYDGQSIDKLENHLTPEEFAIIIPSLKQQIDELHTISENHFGDFVGNDFSTWEDFFKIKFYNHVHNAQEINIISHDDFGIINNAYGSSKEYFKAASATFLHFDIKPSNIVFDKNKGITHLIDFELGRLGDKKFEYARLLTQYRPTIFFNENLFYPLANLFLENDLEHFKKSNEFLLYELYSLLAYYTTSFINLGIARSYLLEPIRKNIRALNTLMDMGN